MKLRTLILLIPALLTFFVSVAQNESQIESQKQVIANLERQIANQERELSVIKKGRTTTQQRVKMLARQVESRNQLLEAQRRQARLLANQLKKSNNTARSLNQDLDRNKTLYAEMVREAYRNYKHENYLTYIFSSRDFTDMARKITNLRHVAEMRRTKMHEINILTGKVAAEKVLLDHRKQSLDSVTTQLQSQRTKLERDARSAREDVRRMSQKEKQQLRKKIAQEQQLSVAINELRKLTRGNKEGDSFTSNTAGLRLPVAAGRLRRYMGNMAEITGPQGAHVNSIYEGKVVEIKRNRITGKYDAYIAHGEYLTSYANLGSVEVTKGQKVAKNQQIGTIGSSVNIDTMETEYKLIFGIYAPTPSQTMRAENCFRK
ncbi:MAG: peptidoglycan DD-metalloendopeptidase family protein [Alistipes sp.]